MTILRALVVFLGDVVKHSDNNGMTGSNVAIVFGPNLFWGKGAGPTSGKIPSVEEMNKVSAFTQFMFDNSEELFAKYAPPPLPPAPPHKGALQKSPSLFRVRRSLATEAGGASSFSAVATFCRCLAPLVCTGHFLCTMRGVFAVES